MPFTLGNEAAGTVTAVGKGVTGFKVGDRVAYVAGLRSYAEEANVPAEVAGETAEVHLLRDRGRR